MPTAQAVVRATEARSPSTSSLAFLVLGAGRPVPVNGRRVVGPVPVKATGAVSATPVPGSACRVGLTTAAIGHVARPTTGLLRVAATSLPASATRQVAPTGVGTSTGTIGLSSSSASVTLARALAPTTRPYVFASVPVRVASRGTASLVRATRVATRPGPIPRGAVALVATADASATAVV